MDEISINTDRLLLRRWKHTDLPPWAALNQDLMVMEFMGRVLSESDSYTFIKRAERSWDELGYGPFAVEVADSHEFIGYIGLAQCNFESHFTPAIEIGWRLAYKFWNLGYATEGAAAVMDWAFNTAALDEVVSFTSTLNSRSRRVMEKIGMERDAFSDFEHPNVALNSPLRPHLLYRRQRPL